MEKPTLNEPLEIIQITKKDMLLSDGSLYEFNALSLPRDWQKGHIVVVAEKYEGESFDLYRIKNNNKDGVTIKANFVKKNQITKNLSPETGKRTPTLNTKLRIIDISDDYIITLQNDDEYKIVRELTLANLEKWGEGQYVKVSKLTVGFEMQNLNTKDSARVTSLNGK